MNKSLLERLAADIPLTLNSGKQFVVKPVPVLSAEGFATVGITDPDDPQHGVLALVEVCLETPNLEMLMTNFEPSDVKYQVQDNRFVHWKNPLADRPLREELWGKLADHLDKESEDV
jgi:hypothetical protein